MRRLLPTSVLLLGLAPGLASAQAFNREELYINGAPVSSGNALPVTGGTGGGGSVGSVGAAGVNGTTAQSIQGITGGVPQAVSISNGSVGVDLSSPANRAFLPSAIGATVGTSIYGGSGPFAAYVLVDNNAPANLSRANIDVENISGAQVVVVRDDGTAAAGSAPVNASWFLLAGGGTGPSQGGAWSSTTFRGRIQLWMATVPTYPPTVMGD
jgi:hypothetical protein